MPKFTLLKKPILTLNILGKSYVVIVSNAVAALVFLITGAAALVLTFTGKLSAENMDVFTKTITNALVSVNGALGNNIFINIIFTIFLIVFVYWIAKKV